MLLQMTLSHSFLKVDNKGPQYTEGAPLSTLE